MTLDTPDVCPPRYNVKVKHKTKGANTVYKTPGGAPTWMQYLLNACLILTGGFIALAVERFFN